MLNNDISIQKKIILRVVKAPFVVRARRASRTITEPFFDFLSGITANLLIALITGLRPLLGPACCKFSVSCTDFAVLKLKEGPLFHAIWEITKRLARCQPFYRPGNGNTK